MNINHPDLLIPEDQLRTAVRCLNIDQDAFDQGVHDRVHRARTSRSKKDVNEPSYQPHAFLRIAASVLPVNLLGGSSTAAQSLLALKGGIAKLIAILAFPAVSILMIAVTIIGLIRIRNVQRTIDVADADAAKIHEEVKNWWSRYGWAAAIIFVLTLASPFFGWTTPLLFAFIGSAIATTSLVVTLGRAGLVDRGTIGASCIMTLVMLAQISQSFAGLHGFSLLDPRLIAATCFLGAGVLAIFVYPVSRHGEGLKSLKSVGFVFLVTVCGLFVLFGTETLWRPVTTATMVKYVETFEPDLPGQWKYWGIVARWLQENNVEYDPVNVRPRMLTNIQATRYPGYLTSIATETGLIPITELVSNEELRRFKARLLDEGPDASILSLDQHEPMIVGLARTGQLTSFESDHVAARLMATWNSLDDQNASYHVLEYASIITTLLTQLDRDPSRAERAADARRWLAEHQVKSKRPFHPSGGFESFNAANFSDPHSTEAAVRLIQAYGATDVVDVMALRSYLRPRSHFGILKHSETMRAATLDRLNHVPGAIKPSFKDYLYRDQALWFAILLVGLFFGATLGSPVLVKPNREYPVSPAT
ncbi:hypothetical protein [Neorhodopirellula pilleata]|uniref:Uncharacterized protein n=1 Tax=Neorhodopirellula pilleata TaxID=2714738 RepID=A0A5C6ADU1_9BACT|nr:hypothetical protein [Neorhodopirellula pilleata]TWT97345.1 hypothetical protein Pla100_24970 [Neorhodopirellula pilleata]